MAWRSASSESQIAIRLPPLQPIRANFIDSAAMLGQYGAEAEDRSQRDRPIIFLPFVLFEYERPDGLSQRNCHLERGVIQHGTGIRRGLDVHVAFPTVRQDGEQLFRI